MVNWLLPDKTYVISVPEHRRTGASSPCFFIPKAMGEPVQFRSFGYKMVEFKSSPISDRYAVRTRNKPLTCCWYIVMLIHWNLGVNLLPQHHLPYRH